jgi:hypothetical protein
MTPTSAAVITCSPTRLLRFSRRWQRAGAPLPLRVFGFVGSPDPLRGCWESHVATLSQLAGPALVMEDDACFADGFTAAVDWPDDADVGYYGGEHMGHPVRTPRFVDGRTVRRTHAYMAADPPALAAALGPPVPGVHLDYCRAWGTAKRYALDPFTVGQLRTRPTFWNPL